jgi:acetyltransferase-like isoleucine patch superfamily enzyme
MSLFIYPNVIIKKTNILTGVLFNNDKHPRSKQSFELGRIIIKKGANVGANSTLLAGIEIGEYAMTGIGSVVTKNVKSYALVYGNPARQKGWIDEEGNKLSKYKEFWISSNGEFYKEIETGLIKI